ncbi:MAG: hypothetical protein IID37_02210 [Planctomycetes bacterium]|nr:hypothetical protein [Planctomycetota bacterium]
MGAIVDSILNKPYDAIVIGSGFGAAVAITKLAAEKKHVLVIERGTWWGNPEGPGLKTKPSAKQVKMHGPRQWWPRPNDSRGLIYLFRSIYKEMRPWVDWLDFRVKDNDMGFERNRNGLYRLTRFSHPNGKVDVVTGNGVGGGSLFYSGVNLIPKAAIRARLGLAYLSDDTFATAAEWMKTYRGRLNKIITKVPVPHRPGTQYQIPPGVAAREYEMPDPDLSAAHEDYMLLDRTRVLKKAVEALQKENDPGMTVGDWHPLPLSVVEYDERVGGDSDKKNSFCLREGRCTIGCLPSARHTLYKTILQLGGLVEVLPQTKVRHIDRKANGQGYEVHFESFVDDDGGEMGSVSGAALFVGAGCLGSAEIMLRSKRRWDKSNGTEGLPLGEMTGRRFSTDGDFFGFARNVDETKSGKVNPTQGPINTCGATFTFNAASANERIDINVEDAGIPTMFARLVHTLLPKFGDWRALAHTAGAVVDALFSRAPFDTPEKPRPTERDQVQYLTERELLSDLFFFNTMGSGPNEPYGTFVLQTDDGPLDLEFDDDKKLADWPVFEKTIEVMGKLASKMKGEFMVSPFWKQEQRVTVVHPLGGCTTGPDRNQGVVDDFGRVFDGRPQSGATDILPGLYIVDASVIPGALGVNPTLTIVAQAVRSVDKAMGEMG